MYYRIISMKKTLAMKKNIITKNKIYKSPYRPE